MTILAAFMVPHPPLIIPDVGKGGEEQIRATIDAYENVASQIAELRPETIIITSPHAVMYADYFHISDGKGATGSFSRFGASQVQNRFGGAEAAEGAEAGRGQHDGGTDHSDQHVPEKFLLHQMLGVCDNGRDAA